MQVRAAVDLGYGFTKALTYEDNRIALPSVAVRSRAAGDLAALLGTQRPQYAISVPRCTTPEVVGEWLVGDAALLAGGVRTWEAPSRRADYPLLVLSGLVLAGAEGDVDLVVGVPLAHYVQAEERRALRQRLSGLHATVAVGGAAPVDVAIQSVRVYPQGVGAYIAALAAPGGADLVGKAAGVVDVGYRTTDYLLMVPAPGGVAVPDEARCGSLDRGIGQAIEAVRRYVAERSGVSVPPDEGLVQAALDSGGWISVRGREINVRQAFDEACRSLSEAIALELRRAWGDRAEYVAAVLVAGGGGRALFGALSGLLPGARLVNDALFANAAGFLRLAELQTTGTPA